jgi:hypothetical protein
MISGQMNVPILALIPTLIWKRLQVKPVTLLILIDISFFLFPLVEDSYVT